MAEDVTRVPAEVFEQMKDKVIPRRCSHCGAREFEMSRTLYAVVPLAQLGLASGRVAPMVLVTCTTCGSTRFFSAKVLGVVRTRNGKRPMLE